MNDKCECGHAHEEHRESMHGPMPCLAYLAVGALLIAATAYLTAPKPVAYCYCALGGYHASDYEVPEDCLVHGGMTP